MFMHSVRTSHEELKPGDHIAVRRWGMAYAHHGIYAGEGRVIHYTDAGGLAAKSRCCVVETTLEEFLGKGSLRVVNHRKPLPAEVTVSRARAALARPGYSLVWNNCEHFASWCRTGRRRSVQVIRAAATFAVGAAFVLARGISRVRSRGA